MICSENGSERACRQRRAGPPFRCRIECDWQKHARAPSERVGGRLTYARDKQVIPPRFRYEFNPEGLWGVHPGIKL